MDFGFLPSCEDSADTSSSTRNGGTGAPLESTFTLLQKHSLADLADSLQLNVHLLASHVVERTSPLTWSLDKIPNYVKALL